MVRPISRKFKALGLEIKVNGRVTCELIDEQLPQRALSGKLGLQVHAGPPMTVMFKDLRMKKL